MLYGCGSQTSYRRHHIADIISVSDSLGLVDFVPVLEQSDRSRLAASRGNRPGSLFRGLDFVDTLGHLDVGSGEIVKVHLPEVNRSLGWIELDVDVISVNGDVVANQLVNVDRRLLALGELLQLGGDPNNRLHSSSWSSIGTRFLCGALLLE